jgi:hypothetical protein
VAYQRLAEKKGNSKAAVAAASKLLRVVYWIMKEQREFGICIFIMSTTTIFYVTIKVSITCVLMRESRVKLTVVAAPSQG